MKRVSVRSLLVSSVAGAFLMLGGAANAASFQFGEVSVALDNTVSLGAGVRASGQDCRHISNQNGGCSGESGFNWGINEDDGNVNFEQWDLYSAAAKLTTDLDVRWRNYGAFVRTTAFYDYIGAEEAGENSTRFGRRPLEDQYRGDDARNAAGRGFDLLDAFVYGNFEVADQPVTARAGQQVVNWGESLFIRGGINSYLPVNVAALRTPGAEVKEGLMPVAALYGNIGLPASFNMELFYMADWKKSKLDPVGTFFASNDFFGPGGEYQLGSGIPDNPPPPAAFGTPGLAPGAASAHLDDEDPDRQGQYGVKIGQYASWLNGGTDLGLYFVNYHSTLPILTFTQPVLSGYLAQYPEDIKTFGASFNTTIPVFGGTALAGEVSYSPNTPFQINTDDLNALAANPVAGLLTGGLVPTTLPFVRAATLEEDGQTVRGYSREDVINGQLHTLSIFNTSHPMVQAVNADSITLLANAGFQYLPSVDDRTLSVLNSPKASSSHPSAAVHGVLNPGNRQANVHADTLSWGYRLVALTAYNNVWNTAWTLTPSLQFAHDVKGMSAGPIGPGFVEDTKTVSVGLTGSYQSSWEAGVQYTNSFGNSVYNASSDKDFLTVNVSYAF